MGLIRMWLKQRTRLADAQAEERHSREQLARTRSEVSRLREVAKQNQFAEMLREGIRAGYRIQEGGQH